MAFPCYPRTARALETAGLAFGPRVTVLPPLGYHDMLALEMHAAVILTDSGGVQREADRLGVPCVTLRDATEWTETVDAGWNVLAGDDRVRIRGVAAPGTGWRSPLAFSVTDAACRPRGAGDSRRGWPGAAIVTAAGHDDRPLSAAASWASRSATASRKPACR